MVPLLAWLRQHQPELMTNDEQRKEGITFEAEYLANDLMDLIITVKLTERVRVWKNEQGIGWEHLPEPPEDPYDGITWNCSSTGNISHGHRRTEPPDQLGRWLAGQHGARRPPSVGGRDSPHLARKPGPADPRQPPARWQPYGPAQASAQAEKKPGRLRRKMFFKISNPSWLKARANEHQAVVEFVGTANRLATIHQYGLKDRIKGREISYPARELLGITEQERDQLETKLLAQLTKGL